MAGPGGTEVGRISLRVVPDTSHLADDLMADLKRIESEASLNIRASVDTDELIESTRVAVDEAQLAAGDIDIHARVDTSQISELETGVAGASSAASGLVSSLSLVSIGVGVLATAVIPLTVALGGLALALTSVAVIGTTGLGIFGLITAGALAKATADAKQVATLQKQIASSTGATQAGYEQQLKNLQAGIPAAEQHLINAMGGIKSAFSDLLTKLGPVIFDPITKAVNLISDALPKLAPILRSFGAVISQMLDGLSGAVNTRGFTSLVNFIANVGARSFKLFGQIIANLAVGVGELMAAFAPLGLSVLQSIRNVTASFAAWAGSKKGTDAIQGFLEWLKTNGPAIGTAIADVFGGLKQAFKDVAPLGLKVIGVFNNIFSALSGMQGVIGPVVAALAGLTLPFVGGPEVAVVFGLAAAFQELYKNSPGFKKAVDTDTSALKKLGDQLKNMGTGAAAKTPGVLSQIQTSLQPVGASFSGFVNSLKGLATAVRPPVQAMVGVFQQNMPQISQIAGQVFTTVRQIIVTQLDLARNAVKAVTAVIAFVWRNFGSTITKATSQYFGGVLKVISGSLSIIQALFKSFDDVLNGRWSAAWKDLEPAVRGFLKVIQGLLDVSNSYVTLIIGEAEEIGKAIVKGIVAGIKAAPKALVDALKNQLQSAIGGAKKWAGIQSPSKLFASEIGAPIAAGIAMGISNNSHLVKNATIGAVTPPDLTSASQAGVAGGSGNGSLIHVDKVEAQDVNHLLRQFNKLSVARNGGGVSLAGVGLA